MKPSNPSRLEQRVVQAAERALADHQYVSTIDILVGLGWLQGVHVSQWRRGQIDYLESVIPTHIEKLALAMQIFRAWTLQKGLKASETAYLAQTIGPSQILQFSKSGDPSIEQTYRTHFISPALSEKKQERLIEKLGQAPELVVFWIRKDAQCSKCRVELPSGSFLIMEQDSPLCLACAHLNHLVYLPSGDAGLTRRAKKYSSRSAVVVRFSPARKRYERQGILVEKAALEKAKAEK